MTSDEESEDEEQGHVDENDDNIDENAKEKGNKHLNVLEKFQALLNNEKGSMTLEEATPLLPFFNSIQHNISAARNRMKKISKENKSLASHLHEVVKAE